VKGKITGAEKVGDKIDRGVSILIYADPGVGKTTLATTLPVGETLIINTEAGLGPCLGTGHYVFNLDQNLKQLQKLYEEIANEKHPFKYIVLDNISELQDWMVMTLTQSRGKDFTEIREHGDTGQKMREYLHLFRDLVFKGITVVFNAWEYPLEIETGPEVNVTKLFPKLYKRIAPEICGIVDIVGHLEMYEKTGERFIRLEGNSKLIAKSQFKGLEKFEPADLMQLLAKIRAYDYTRIGEDTTRGLESVEKA
jgi:phage nucleotide-binding protein